MGNVTFWPSPQFILNKLTSALRCQKHSNEISQSRSFEFKEMMSTFTAQLFEQSNFFSTENEFLLSYGVMDEFSQFFWRNHTINESRFFWFIFIRSICEKRSKAFSKKFHAIGLKFKCTVKKQPVQLGRPKTRKWSLIRAKFPDN
jgi:hypothetical protein